MSNLPSWGHGLVTQALDSLQILIVINEYTVKITSNEVAQ